LLSSSLLTLVYMLCVFFLGFLGRWWVFWGCMGRVRRHTGVCLASTASHPWPFIHQRRLSDQCTRSFIVFLFCSISTLQWK
jgi:hypothetical protein